MRLLVLCLALSLGGTGAEPPVQSRVVGGRDCQKHSQPWQVAVYHYTRFQCGGVLVHPQWVLTAAHCISHFPQVWLGRHDLFEHEDSAQYFRVSGSFPHPDFNMEHLKEHIYQKDKDYSHDLMLLHLSQPARITEAVKVLELPTQEPEVGSTCLTSGWGSTDPEKFEAPYNLQCMDLEILPTEVCDKAHPQKLTDTMLCAGDLKGGKDTCVGDSGGPLICNGEFQGVLSWGHVPCGSINKPAVYTKVLHYMNWIKDTIKNNP